MENWPKYYNRMILKPSLNGQIGIVCGWTKKEDIERNLKEEEKKKIGAIGQLYSKEGLNFIIRNLFLNPNLKHLVITGLDLSGSISFMKDFLDNKEKGEDVIHKEIPKEKIEEFKKWFSSNSYFVNENDLSKTIDSLKSNSDTWTSKTENFPDPQYQEGETFPNEEVGFRLEDKKVATLWLKVLDYVNKFGTEKKSQYGENQREIVGLLTVISDENPDNPYLPNYLIFKEKELERYFKQIMTSQIPKSLEYTYGSKLRDHNEIDQIQSIVNQIKKENFTRRAIAFTWNVEKDNLNPKSPCLDLIQVLVNNNKLHLTCYFRSNDMFGAWPQNTIALRKIQKEISEKTNIEMGKLMILSNSAHIYERDYEKSKEVVKKHKPKLDCQQDPRGNFVIEIVDQEIKVTQTTPDGKAIQNFKGKTAVDLFHQIYPFLSQIPHALDLGAELQKAEIALKQNIEYLQDNTLKF